MRIAIHQFPLILVVFFAGQIAHAQQSAPDIPAPFAQIDETLERAADESLARPSQIALSPPVPDRVALANPSGVHLRPSIRRFQSGPSQGLDEPALRLAALGVDAARIFGEEGVPVDFLAVASVESGFNPRALSRKGALGLWQFMPETALRYNLRVNRQVDERLSPSKSTRAAARYLRDLHLRFGDWLLALAAYNAGEDAVQHAIDRGGSADFWALSNRKLLPAETRAYVPSVLRALDVSRDREKISRGLSPDTNLSAAPILYASPILSQAEPSLLLGGGQ